MLIRRQILKRYALFRLRRLSPLNHRHIKTDGADINNLAPIRCRPVYIDCASPKLLKGRSLGRYRPIAPVNVFILVLGSDSRPEIRDNLLTLRRSPVHIHGPAHQGVVALSGHGTLRKTGHQLAGFRVVKHRASFQRAIRQGHRGTLNYLIAQRLSDPGLIRSGEIGKFGKHANGLDTEIGRIGIQRQVLRAN